MDLLIAVSLASWQAVTAADFSKPKDGQPIAKPPGAFIFQMVSAASLALESEKVS